MAASERVEDITLGLVRDLTVKVDNLTVLITAATSVVRPTPDCRVAFAMRRLTYLMLSGLSVAVIILGATLILLHGPEAVATMLNVSKAF